jgi:hypothetical protein
VSADSVPPEWEETSRDPDPVRDLGYEMIDLEVFETEEEETDRYMFLPGRKDMLADDAFIVASEGAVCDVDDRL